MLGIAPLAGVDGEVVLCALPERHLLGLLGSGGERGAIAGFDRVKAAGELCLAIVPQLSCQRERDHTSASEAHLALDAKTLKQEDPAFSAVGELQVKIAAIRIAALATNASHKRRR